jgi:pilus assembly protein Flp/PilA
VKSYSRKIVTFINDETGASASEYGLLVVLIAVVIVAGVMAFGNKLAGLYSNNTAEVVKAFPNQEQLPMAAYSTTWKSCGRSPPPVS